MRGPAPPGWYADPFRRHEHRFWDGRQWTCHVGTRGVRWTDEPGFRGHAPVGERDTAPATPRKVAVRREYPAVDRAQSPAEHRALERSVLFTESVLVFRQRVKLVGSAAAYTVTNQHRQEIASVREVDRGVMTRLSDKQLGLSDRNRTYKLHLLDPEGRLLLQVTRPDKWWGSTVYLHRAGGTPVGRMTQRGTASLFRLEAEGGQGGEMQGGSRGATVHTHSGDAVAEITRDRRGSLGLKSTKADRYVVTIEPEADETMRAFAIAGALAIDIVLRQR